MVHFLLFADSLLMSGETAPCTADMTVNSRVPLSATVVLMLHRTQVTAMADQRRFEGVRLKGSGDVRGPQSAVHGRTINTSHPAVVAQPNETDNPAHLIAIKEVGGLQIGITTATANDLGRTTASGRAIYHGHENTVIHTVIAAMVHAHIKVVKTATIGRHEIESHLWQTVGDHGHPKLMIHLNRISRKNYSVLGSLGHQKSKMVAVINGPDTFLHCVVLYFVISLNSVDSGMKFWYFIVCE